MVKYSQVPVNVVYECPHRYSGQILPFWREKNKYWYPNFINIKKSCTPLLCVLDIEEMDESWKVYLLLHKNIFNAFEKGLEEIVVKWIWILCTVGKIYTPTFSFFQKKKFPISRYHSRDRSQIKCLVISRIFRFSFFWKNYGFL